MIPLRTRRGSGRNEEFTPGLSLWLLRSKAQSIFFGMIFMMMLFIIYKATGSYESGSVNLQLKLDKSKYSTEILQNSKFKKLENINELMQLTQSADHLNRQKAIESHILAGDKNFAELGHDNVLLPDTNSVGSAKQSNNNYMTRSMQPIFRGHRIVHLDLKGAPPKISYLEEIFPLLKELGGTGLLIEYEDMFPYRNIELRARNAYTKNDISEILKLAANNDLIVIPLIQTFGHLEFMLKLKNFKHLRESPRYPQVICPSNNNSLSLIKEMIDDMIELHPSSDYIHIGSDEVYNLGECAQCVDVMKKMKWNKRDLFLHHMTSVAKYIKERHAGLTVLAWDDEFRQMSAEELLKSKVGKLVEPVVWKYTDRLPEEMSVILTEIYPSVFPSIWIASAFKGATGPDMYATDIDYHWNNHRSWMHLVSSLSKNIHFKGIFLTGWQRYDHFSVLCELLPVGFPSLAVNLAYLSSSKLSESSWPCPKAERILKCDNILGLKKIGFSARCSFPGAPMFELAMSLYTLNEDFKIMVEGSHFRGWFSHYNVEMMFASPSHVEEAVSELGRIRMELSYIKRNAQKIMPYIYDSSVYDEWVATFINPLELKLDHMWEAKEKLLSKDDWPRRPLTRPQDNQRAVDDGL